MLLCERIAQGEEGGMTAQKKRHIVLVQQIRDAVAEIERLKSSLSKPAATKTRQLLGEINDQVAHVVSQLDPVRLPDSWFDPTDPDSAGRLVAAALMAQPRVPLGLVPRSYGAGVYAIYYKGDHPVYTGIRNTETPIYVGKADPASPNAKTPREQGQKLYGRLNDHRKMIKAVESYAVEQGDLNVLRVEDFECRRLVTATNAQLFAERHLISIFRPLWNQETRICWGISKHGDTEGRNNARSPWDVLHPGRKWALAKKLSDSRPREKIISDIEKHITAFPPYNDREAVIEHILAGFAQDPMTVDSPASEHSESGKSSNGKKN